MESWVIPDFGASRSRSQGFRSELRRRTSLSSIATVNTMIRVHDIERSSGSTPAAKRQKIAIACDACRKRKIRCDGKAPVCTQCVSGRKVYTCTYERKPSERQQETSQELENSLAQDGMLRTYAATTVHTGLGGIPGANNGGSRPTVASDEPQSVVFGESASTTFSNRVSQHQQHPQQGFDFNGTNKGPFKLDGSADKAGVLPRRRVADEMIDHYWDFVHPLFPILHQPTFMAAYEKSWTSQPNHGTRMNEGRQEFEEALFFSTLNVMFALGTRFCESATVADKGDMAKEFYNRSRQTFAYDLLDCASLPVLQMVVLQGIYLQSTTEVSRCWNVIGVATRMAQSLGLHSEQTYQRQKVRYVREMGRRLWHACIVLDRLAAATFGWPMMVHSDHSVSLPVVGDDALRQQGGELPASREPTHGLHIFRYACELFGIVGDILSTLYCNNGALLPASADLHQRSRTLSQIMGLNGQLEAYLITIPDFLRIGIDGPEQVDLDDLSKPMLAIQQAISCRYHYASFLFYDADMTEEEGVLSPNDKLTIHTVEKSAATSFRLLEILHGGLASPLYIADWHIVYMTFTAATSLLAIKRCASAQTQKLHEAIDNKIKWSHHILHYIGLTMPISLQALHSLQALDSHVAVEIAPKTQDSVVGTVVPTVERDIGDSTLVGFGEMDDFDWLANPSVLLSRQSPGFDWDWLEVSDSWLS
ncbi:unnamed protein product, partial [Aureobasidium uvarum]